MSLAWRPPVPQSRPHDVKAVAVGSIVTIAIFAALIVAALTVVVRSL